MLTIHDVLETNQMIQKNNLDVRTITMGISLLDCCASDGKTLCNNIYDKITRYGEHLVETGEAISREYGVPIINTILMPLAMAILASRLWDVEVKGCTPKLLYTLQSRRSLFAAKAALGLAEIFLIVTLEAAGAPLIGHLQHYTQPYPAAGQAAYLWGCTFAVDCMIFFSELLLTVLLANPLPALCVGILGTLLGLFSAFMPAWVGYFVPWGYFIPLNTYRIADWDQASKVVTYMIVPFQWPLLVATVVLAGILFFAAWYAMRNKEV